eukprot:4792782-Amphidinium_carterae.2
MWAAGIGGIPIRWPSSSRPDSSLVTGPGPLQQSAISRLVLQALRLQWNTTTSSQTTMASKHNRLETKPK